MIVEEGNIMSNAYEAKALNWQLIVGGDSQPILQSDELADGTEFAIAGSLPDSFYVYVFEMRVNHFENLLYGSSELLSGEVSIPDAGASLTTDRRAYVRAVAAPGPIPDDAWPQLVPALFKIHREGPPSAGNSDTM